MLSYSSIVVGCGAAAVEQRESASWSFATMKITGKNIETNLKRNRNIYCYITFGFRNIGATFVVVRMKNTWVNIVDDVFDNHYRTETKKASGN